MYQFKTDLFESHAVEVIKRIAARLKWKHNPKDGTASKGSHSIKYNKDKNGKNTFRYFKGGKHVKDFNSDEEVADHFSYI